MYLLCKYGVLEVEARLRLHWKDSFGCCAPLKPVTTVQKSANSREPSKKPPAKAVFSFQEID